MTVEQLASGGIVLLVVVAVTAYRAGRNYEWRQREQARNEPATITAGQITEIQTLCHELQQEEPDDLAEWNWTRTTLWLVSLRGRQRDREFYMRHVEQGGYRNRPMEYVYGLTWDDETSNWIRTPPPGKATPANAVNEPGHNADQTHET